MNSPTPSPVRVAEGRVVQPGPIEASMRAQAVAARRRLMGKPVSVSAVLPPPPAPAVPVMTPTTSHLVASRGRAVVLEVASAHSLNWRDLVGPSRERRIVTVRNEVAFRLVTELGMSYPKAGRILGGRDHTTVLHGCRRHAQTSPEAAEAWRRHVECETEERSHKVGQALRLHADGLTTGQIAARLRVAPPAVALWIKRAG